MLQKRFEKQTNKKKVRIEIFYLFNIWNRQNNTTISRLITTDKKKKLFLFAQGLEKCVGAIALEFPVTLFQIYGRVVNDSCIK